MALTFPISALVEAARPRQWTKNLIVFAGPLFSFRFEPEPWLGAAGACLAFCLVSSAVYLLNDVIDIEDDRRHPSKRFRAIASGRLPKPLALFASATLLLASLLLGLLIHSGLGMALLIYALIQVAYCLRLKREPLLDLLCIASGFLLRAMAGVLGAGIGFSPWFLLTVGLLALFLAVEKRKAELRRVEASGVVTRKVLQRYGPPAPNSVVPPPAGCCSRFRLCWWASSGISCSAIRKNPNVAAKNHPNAAAKNQKKSSLAIVAFNSP